MNDSQLARCGPSVVRFPLSSRPIVEKRFSTGTDKTLKQFFAAFSRLGKVLSSRITVDRPLDLAEVTAIYKKGRKLDRANYKPVSLTSVCCNMLESLIRDHIMRYLLENELLSNRQYWFIN